MFRYKKNTVSYIILVSRMSYILNVKYIIFSFLNVLGIYNLYIILFYSNIILNILYHLFKINKMGALKLSTRESSKEFLRVKYTTDDGSVR